MQPYFCELRLNSISLTKPEITPCFRLITLFHHLKLHCDWQNNERTLEKTSQLFLLILHSRQMCPVLSIVSFPIWFPHRLTELPKEFK